MKTEFVKTKYASEAYDFVREAVNYAIGRIGEARHVSALELLENCRLYAREQYGFLAQSVLESWRIFSADDIGAVVYELIEIGKLSASPGDAREDFSIKFDLFDQNTFRIKHTNITDKPLIDD